MGVHYFMPETKMANTEWSHKNFPPPRKGEDHSLCRERMASNFWDSQAFYSSIFLQNNKLSMLLKD
jgi:hypothetical protein